MNAYQALIPTLEDDIAAELDGMEPGMRTAMVRLLQTFDALPDELKPTALKAAEKFVQENA